VEQLLTLSRLEAGAQPPMQGVDLMALARQLVAELAIPALQKGQQIELDLPETTAGVTAPACSVQGDATLLGLLLRNLVDNAIRYCPAGASVQVSVGREADGHLVLAVEDSGPGLAEADLARLGERFFRVLGSGASGSGLGWSIVRRIAAVHGVAVQVQRSAHLGGLAVVLHWPLA
jgi:two-component system sensor histidine kinase QseC